MRRIWGRPRWRPRLSRLAIGAAIAAALAWGAGFVWFTESIPRAVKKPHEVTDAIVVLTGGAGRLIAGLELLAEGRAAKL
ncbi:MAG: YdcF family protein, partial [Pseudomonadota bacterium]|nr:YdcF family protein [Pseudomonadota bacterium]